MMPPGDGGGQGHHECAGGCLRVGNGLGTRLGGGKGSRKRVSTLRRKRPSRGVLEVLWLLLPLVTAVMYWRGKGAKMTGWDVPPVGKLRSSCGREYAQLDLYARPRLQDAGLECRSFRCVLTRHWFDTAVSLLRRVLPGHGG